MKKVFIVLLLLIFLPFRVEAADTYIENYYIDMTVREDGNILVKELFTYKGKFNGVFKTLSYDTNLTNTDSLFVAASLYSPNEIELIGIKDIKVDNDINFDYLFHDGTYYTRNDSAAVGSSGYYSVTEGYKEYTYKIFNPGTYKGFYIEYVLRDSVVTHEDISEVWLNVFRDNPDYIEHLEIVVNLPNNENMLKSWAHGPLTGIINIINNQKVSFTVDDLEVGNDIDIRLAFDSYPSVLKKTNITALNQIIEYETVLANEANEEREEQRQLYSEYVKREKEKATIFNLFGCIWLIGLPFLIKYIYKNYDKEYISEFKGKYFRDIPNDNNPALVGYLLNKKVGVEDLSATILNLINKKKIDFIKLEKNNYKFVLADETDLDEMEKLVLVLLFKDQKETRLSDFKKRARSGYSEFLSKYNEWNNEALNLAKEKNYFEEKVTAKIISILYSISGLIFLFFVNSYTNRIIIIAVAILGFISLIYFSSYTKRTNAGNEEYLKWIGLKNFMNDFGKMDIKELPEVRLWEKYLVYAVTLGCASKLAKTMKIKVQELNDATTINTINFTDHLFLVTNMNTAITSSVNSAISTAKSVAASQNSSGIGSGGGFSGGGHSGGGFSGGGGGSTGHF